MRAKNPQLLKVNLIVGIVAALLIVSPIGRHLFAADSASSAQENALRPLMVDTGNPVPTNIPPAPPPQSNMPNLVLPNGRILSTVIQTITLYNAPSLNAQPVGLLLAGQHWFVIGTDSTGNWVLVQITLSTSGWTIRRAFSIPGTLSAVTGTVGGQAVSVFGSGRAFAYRVRAGDTLGALAFRYRTTIARLAQINRIVNPDLIFVGQMLTIA
jgi:hypothetical protein